MKGKQWLALILVLVLSLTVLASCSSDSPSDASSSEPEPSNSESSGEEESSGGETPQVPEGDNVNGSINQQSYPIVDEKVTLSMWYPMAGSMGELSDFNEGEFWKWYEEKTNIHIDFIVPAANTEKDAFNLLFVSDDMPDMLYTQPGDSSTAHNYRGGEDKAIEDGYFIDMNEYLEYSPNYVSWINNQVDTGYQRAIYTDTGRLYGMWALRLPMDYEIGVMAELGVSIRQDFLDAVGMDIPTTYDEWYDVLVAFRDELGIEAPFYTDKYGIDYTGEFMAGFGTAPYFYQVDGTIKYGPMDDEYKEYLTMLNQWYDEGLLDQDFPTRANTAYSPDAEMMLNDKVGACIDWATRLSDTYISRGATNEDFYLVAAPQPTKGDGTVPKFHTVTGHSLIHGACVVFSAESDYIEEAIRWNDGFYAEDVYLNANYGLEDQEGVVWYAAEDGHRIGDYDFRYANPNGLSSATVLVQYWTKNPPVRVEAAQIEQADDNKQSAYVTWSQYDAEWVIPRRTTMTADESTTYSSIYTDIETYVQECTVKFITGSMSLDTYDAFRDTLRQMGIEEAISYRQAALDRYNQR